MSLKTFTSLFSGYGIGDAGFEAAGLAPLNHFEICPRLAEVGQANTRGEYVVGDICETNWHRYEAPDHLHASPVCTRASVANSNAEESPLDLATAEATMRAVAAWRPATFTLENVWGYRTFRAFAWIESELKRLGYQYDFWHLCSADFGVPQTRRRLILCARLGGPKPLRPEVTHAKTPVATLFGSLERWRGWYEAIEDILDTLPESQFAPWQLARLPEHFSRSFISDSLNYSSQNPNRWASQPAQTVVCHSPKHPEPRAFVVEGSAAGVGNAFTMPIRAADEPIFTMRANQNNPRAVLYSDQSARDGIGLSSRIDSLPAHTILAKGDARGVTTLRAFLCEGANASREITLRQAESPSFTIGAGSGMKVPIKAFESGRVVAMTSRALARFMSLPDTFELSGNRKLDCKGLGNGFPSLMAQRVMESLYAS